MALAHHIMTVIYHILAKGTEYKEMGGDYYDRRNKPKVVSRLVERLNRLGYYVDLRPATPIVLPGDTISPATDPPVGRDADSLVQTDAVVTPDCASVPLPSKHKRGRPCKCLERGINCKHRTLPEVNLLIPQPSAIEEFS